MMMRFLAVHVWRSWSAEGDFKHNWGFGNVKLEQELVPGSLQGDFLLRLVLSYPEL